MITQCGAKWGILFIQQHLRVELAENPYNEIHCQRGHVTHGDLPRNVSNFWKNNVDDQRKNEENRRNDPQVEVSCVKRLWNQCECSEAGHCDFELVTEKRKQNKRN